MATRSLIGVLVATTTAPAVTTGPASVSTRAGSRLDLRGVGLVWIAPPLLDGVGEAGEVLERMELPLAREAEAAPGVERRRTGPWARISTSFSPARARPRVPDPAGPADGPGQEQVAVDAEEVAVDPLVLGDRLDSVDGRGVALGGQAAPSSPWTFSISR